MVINKQTPLFQWGRGKLSRLLDENAFGSKESKQTLFHSLRRGKKFYAGLGVQIIWQKFTRVG
jgi:hypothetical protein